MAFSYNNINNINNKNINFNKNNNNRHNNNNNSNSSSFYKKKLITAATSLFTCQDNAKLSGQHQSYIWSVSASSSVDLSEVKYF